MHLPIVAHSFPVLNRSFESIAVCSCHIIVFRSGLPLLTTLRRGMTQGWLRGGLFQPEWGCT
jgi:hypothetical protein